MELTEQNRRKHHRVDCEDTVVMNPEGACEVIEMSSGGFSFQCLFEHSLSEEWTVDILNNTGIYLQKFSVEKVWESLKEEESHASLCRLAVGVRFKDLSPKQQLTLDNLVLLNTSLSNRDT
jgi:hypothetical protein